MASTKYVNCTGKMSAVSNKRIFGLLRARYDLYIKLSPATSFTFANSGYTSYFTVTTWTSGKYTFPTKTFSTYFDGSNITFPNATDDRLYYNVEVIGAATPDQYLVSSAIFDGNGDEIGRGGGEEEGGR